MQNPSMTPCHHAFCHECLERMLRTAGKSDLFCPICKGRISRRSLVPAVSLTELSDLFHDLAQIYERENGREYDAVEGEDDIDADKENEMPLIMSDTLGTSQEIKQLKTLDAEIDKELVAIDSMLKSSKTCNQNVSSALPRMTMEIDTLALLDEAKFPSSPADLFVKLPPTQKRTQTQTTLQQSSTPLIQSATLTGSPLMNIDRKIVFTTSLIRSKDRTREFSQTFAHNGQVVFDSKFSSKTTHLVTPERALIGKRTLKMMRAILKGCWIVSTDWLEACLTAGRLIHEAPFELQGDEYFPEEEGPQRARLSRINKEEGLFANMSFYLYGSFAAPSLEEAALLIEEGGGSIISTLQELEGYRGECFVLCDPREQLDFEKDAEVIKKHPPLLQIHWLMDCISAFQIVDLTPHLVL